MARVLQVYETIVGGEFKHRSAWNFLKDRHKWKNSESTLQRRSRLRGTDKEPNHFGDDELPRPPGLQRIAKSQRTSSNSTAYQEFMAEQYDLDRKAKMQVLSQESEDRRRLIQAQKIAEDMKVLQIDTSGMNLTYAAIINAQNERIRAEYLPPN
ncbi:cellulose synthase A catalytic subunit 7 [Tanacetum coccineum]